MTSINSDNLRFLWSLVENYGHLFQEMSDDTLSFWLLKRLRANIQFDHAETQALKTYIGNRIPLIRDVAASEGIQNYHTPA